MDPNIDEVGEKSEGVKRGYFCGQCKNKYSKKQNWEEHFNSKKNICYNTRGPRVWAHSLDIAVKKYQDEVQQRDTAKQSFSLFTKCASARPQKNEPTSSTANLENETFSLDVSQTEESASPPPKKQKVSEESAHQTNKTALEEFENSQIQKTLNAILRLTKETHQAVVVNKEKSQNMPSSSSVASKSNKAKSNKFDISIAHLSKCKSIQEILNNDLIKSTFKLVEKKDLGHADDSFSVPSDIMENIANSDTNMPDVDIAVEDEDDDNQEDIDDASDDKMFTLYCIACTDPKACASDKHSNIKGYFNVKDLTYVCKQGENQERWFRNLKTHLKRHLIKLQHHQRAAVYEVMKTSSRNTTKRIEDLCGNILYYIMKTNTAWALYPVLLAVLHRSGCEVGNLNHSTHACETICELLDNQLKEQTVKWFLEQTSVTITADIGTILGLSMLVVLVMSEEDKTVKLAGINLVRSKSGVYLANEIFDVLKSPNHLKLSEEAIKSKVSGMVGDGAFCKDNEPFKNEMKKLFGENFKFRWDLMHLVNRAHVDALKKICKLSELLDFIQNHSSNLRSGLDYTNMVLDNIIGFKRPKLKSDTRMVNYEFDQFDRFVENCVFFDHPQEKEISAKFYVLISYVTKIMLQVAQKTTVSAEFVENIFYKEGGKTVMLRVMETISKLANGGNANDVVSEFKHDTTGQQKELTAEDYILNEVYKYIKKRSDYYQVAEVARPSRTRSESSFTKDSVINWLTEYIEQLWKGITERLKHFDKDGSTAWSEAPAEGTFSILGYIVEHKGSIKPSHLTKLCRIVKEGPAPGTRSAVMITQKAIDQWPSIHGGKFTTNAYMQGLTSSTVAAAMNK